MIGFQSMSDWIEFFAVMAVYNAGWFILAFVHLKWERQLSTLRACLFSFLTGSIVSLFGFALSEATLRSSFRIVLVLFWLACPYLSLTAWGLHRRLRRRQAGR
jgi:hypothetical protein